MPDAAPQTRPTVANAARVEQGTRAAMIAPQIAANEKSFQNPEQSSASIFLSERKRNRVFFAPRWKIRRKWRPARILGRISRGCEFLGGERKRNRYFFVSRWSPPGPVVTRNRLPRWKYLPHIRLCLWRS
jgi:hypothetical protein